MRKLTPSLLCDFYKTAHKDQYPEGTEYIYSTWTPRTSRIPQINKVVHFGLQMFIKEFLQEYWNVHFFNKSEEEVATSYNRIIKNCLNQEKPNDTHIRALHKLGYLPLRIYSLPEGTLVPIRVPTITIENTHPDFFWVTNYIESLMSAELWQASTSATLAYQLRKCLEFYCNQTVKGGFVPFQAHDFSMRGMSSLSSAVKSGMGHLLSFVGTDTIPAIEGMEIYYNADCTKEVIGTSIPATEHSVMCANGLDEEAVFKRLITEVYPTGFVSIVSDTWDFWNVVENVLPKLKDTILQRSGKVVIRPDSGDPLKILCGDPGAANEMENKGLVESLYTIFGGCITDGYKELDPHIGTIYGDAINLDKLQQINKRLIEKGFASTNVVYGIGSYTYQYNTRDTFGYAMKSTHAVINGKNHFLYKNPKTDNGIKESQKGKVAVLKNKDTGELQYIDGLHTHEFQGNLMNLVFEDGQLLIEEDLSSIRDRLWNWNKC